MESILFDYRKRVDEDTGEQFVELCNELETSEAIEEKKVDKKNDQEVVKQLKLKKF